MKPSQRIIRENTTKNGVTIYWVESKPKNKLHSAGYPVLWGYVVNGKKFTSLKKANEEANKLYLNE